MFVLRWECKKMNMSMNRQMRQFQKAYENDALEAKVLGATPLGLIVLLYEGAIEALEQAQQAMRHGNIALKGQMVNKASDIIEGLRAAINFEKGGSISISLNELYIYAKQRVTDGHQTNSEAALQEVVGLLQTLLEAWKQIAKQEHVSVGDGVPSCG